MCLVKASGLHSKVGSAVNHVLRRQTAQLRESQTWERTQYITCLAVFPPNCLNLPGVSHSVHVLRILGTLYLWTGTWPEHRAGPVPTPFAVQGLNAHSKVQQGSADEHGSTQA